MKLSQIEKRIPQTLTNSENLIQTDREYARRSSRARSTRGQENEAWALYKKIPSRGSWGALSRDRYIICPKPPYPAGKINMPGSSFLVFSAATSSSIRKFSSLFLCLFVNVIEVKTLVFSSLFPRALLFSRLLFSWHFKAMLVVLSFHCQYARHELLSSIFPVRI